LKKCIPTTRSGALVPAAIPVTEQLALHLEVFECGLDHQLAPGQLGKVGRERQAFESGALLIPGEPALLDSAAEVVVDPLARALAELWRDLAADDLEARLRADLRDPGTHRAEPDDPDPLDLHGARSYALRAPRSRVNLCPRGLRPLTPVLEASE
jgi:hypothetical protein